MNSKISTNVFEEAGITPETLIKLGLPQDSRSLSPMMVHYCQTKCAYKDSILFFRLGDFYEMFFDDAKLVSRELNLSPVNWNLHLPAKTVVFLNGLRCAGFRITQQKHISIV